MTNLQDLLIKLSIAIESDSKEAIKKLLKKIVSIVREDESEIVSNENIFNLISCINPFNEIKNELATLLELYIDKDYVSDSLIDSPNSLFTKL